MMSDGDNMQAGPQHQDLVRCAADVFTMDLTRQIQQRNMSSFGETLCPFTCGEAGVLPRVVGAEMPFNLFLIRDHGFDRLCTMYATDIMAPCLMQQMVVVVCCI